jgi:hypothetical protein
VSIVNCQSCELNFGSGLTECSTCLAGFYRAGSMGVCMACIIGCATCTYLTFVANHVHCYTCYPTFKRAAAFPHNCYCEPNEYIVYTTPPACTPCPAACSSCSDATTCSGCNSGYFLVASSCVGCLPVCSTCASPTTCSSCASNLLVSGSTCICAAPKLLDPSTLTCISCGTFDPNCLTCAYSPAYDPAAPTPIVCTVPKIGYFLQANGTTAACGSYCSQCTSSALCTTCQPTFTPSGGLCDCAPLTLASGPPTSCQSCASLIAGCSSCVDETTCSGCVAGFYPNGSLPTSGGCLPCPSTCSSCTDATTCTGCLAPFTPFGTDCLCSLGNFVDVAQAGCDLCGNIIVKCAACVAALPTTCSSCQAGYFPSANGLRCLPCPSNCLSCDGSSCSSCSAGYTPNLNGCDCDASCQACIASTGTCSQCAGMSCSGCVQGSYLSGTACLSCLPSCLSCSSGASCASCAAPFELDSGGNCLCDNQAGLWLTLDSTTCLSCGSVIPNCLACLATPSTVCSLCSSGFLSAGAVCTACLAPCLTCSGSTISCDSCQPTYTLAGTNCYCDNAAQLFYSSTTLGCLACSNFLPLCLTCQVNGGDPTLTDCILCQDPYYPLGNPAVCVPCDIRCTSCSSLAVCSTCATNLVTVGTACGCDTLSDPLLSYDTDRNTCYPCTTLLSNCLSCNPDPLACTLCAPGTYLSGTVCLNCPTSCATCDLTGCLSCPSGMTPQGLSCVCDTACSRCSVTAANCLSCSLTASGVLTACSSCLPRYQLALDGVSCDPCPSGCGTCSGGACSTCLSTFSLQGPLCKCDSSIGLYISPQTSCLLCGDLFFGC